jgi:hypothetical protein
MLRAERQIVALSRQNPVLMMRSDALSFPNSNTAFVISSTNSGSRKSWRKMVRG